MQISPYSQKLPRARYTQERHSVSLFGSATASVSHQEVVPIGTLKFVCCLVYSHAKYFGASRNFCHARLDTAFADVLGKACSAYTLREALDRYALVPAKYESHLTAKSEKRSVPENQPRTCFFVPTDRTSEIAPEKVSDKLLPKTYQAPRPAHLKSRCPSN